MKEKLKKINNYVCILMFDFCLIEIEIIECNSKLKSRDDFYQKIEYFLFYFKNSFKVQLKCI